MTEFFKKTNEDRTDLEKKIFSLLDKEHITYERIDNSPVFTMEECLLINQKLQVEIRKSILLCNAKKTTFFLVVLPADKSLDTSSLEKKLHTKKLSFASDTDMQNLLGCTPGSLSVMGVIEDKDEYVQVIIDKEILNDDYFGCNDTVNTTHIKIKTKDLIDKYLKKNRHKPIIIDL